MYHLYFIPHSTIGALNQAYYVYDSFEDIRYMASKNLYDAKKEVISTYHIVKDPSILLDSKENRKDLISYYPYEQIVEDFPEHFI